MTHTNIDNTHTDNDRTDLDSVHQTYTTWPSRGERAEPSKHNTNSYISYRTESRMEVNNVKFPPLSTHTPAGTSQETPSQSGQVKWFQGPRSTETQVVVIHTVFHKDF